MSSSTLQGFLATPPLASSASAGIGLVTDSLVSLPPVGLWNLDGDALDASGNDNHGSAVNTVSYAKLGGRQFLHIPNVGVGTPGYINVPADPAFQLDGDLSLFLLAANLNGFSATGFLVNCGDNSGASDPDRQLFGAYMSSSSAGYPGIQWKQSAVSYSMNSTLSPTTIERGCSLFSLGFVRDATADTLTVFYNGAEVETGAGRQPPTAGQGASNALQIGANFGGASLFSGGIIGSVALYDGVLTAAEIRTLNDATLGA